MWSFVGWETITHLTGEFRHPRRDVPRATAAAILIIGTLYLAVAFAIVAVLGPRAAEADAPFGELMAVGLGGSARIPAAVAALLLTFGAMNAYQCVLLLLAMTGVYLVWPLVVTGCALLYLRYGPRRRPAPADDAPLPGETTVAAEGASDHATHGKA